MSVARPTDSRWRGWAAASGSDGEVVTSTRLALGGAALRRVFPKTRSWFALDSPMELLSPLSVLRALYGVAIVFWPLAGLAWRWSGLAVRVVLPRAWSPSSPGRCCSACERWRRGGARCWWASGCSTRRCSCGRVTARAMALAFVPFYGVMGIFVALFFPARSVFVYQAVSAVALWAGLRSALGVGPAAVVSAVVAVATGATVATVFLLTRSSRRQGTLDPDTGLLNGFGFASRLSTRDQGVPIAVAAVLVRGIAEAREALGYRVGTELLRRVVENLGQVLPTDALIGRVEGDIAIVARSAACAARSERRRSTMRCCWLER